MRLRLIKSFHCLALNEKCSPPKLISISDESVSTLVFAIICTMSKHSLKDAVTAQLSMLLNLRWLTNVNKSLILFWRKSDLSLKS